MAEQLEERRDAATEPEKRDAAPESTTVVGKVTAAPPDPPMKPEEKIEELNRENATRRVANKTLTDENALLKERLASLEASVSETARKAELEKMSETDKLRQEKLDSDRKAEEAIREANETLKRAAVTAMAAGMDLVPGAAGDAVAVIDLNQVSVLNGKVDEDSVRTLLNSAVEARPHWKKAEEKVITPVPPDPGPGNPAPEGERGGPIPTHRVGADPWEAVKQAQADYRRGHTSLPRLVHNLNKAFENDPKAMEKIFPDPSKKPS